MCIRDRMRTIDPGEELLIDYAMGKATPDEWDCTCGSPLCRGVITGDDWKIKELQRRYKGYFTPYVESHRSTRTPTGRGTARSRWASRPTASGTAATSKGHAGRPWWPRSERWSSSG